MAIAAGYQFNLAAKADGTVTAWGNNSFGQTNVPAGLSNVVDVAAGPYHSLALLKNGTVVAWGDGSDGETNVPPGLTNVVAIAAGGDQGNDSAYSLALKSDGTVVKWGEGEVMDGVGGLSKVVAIGAGADHALAIRTGPPTSVITLEPTDQYQVAGRSVIFTARGTGIYGVSYQWQTNGVNIAGGTNAALTLTNVQAGWVSNCDVVVSDNGGMGSLVSFNAHLYIVTPPVITTQSVLGSQFVLSQSNVVLTVGAAALGQINGFPLSYQWQFDGTNLPGATSSALSFPATNSGTYSVIVTNAAGATNVSWSLVARGPGSLWAWGADDYKQTDLPLWVTNAMAIAAGYRHSLAALDNGAVVAWGDNGYGQTNVPSSLSNVVAVAAGQNHSLALKTDGTIVAWGDNTYGQRTPPTGLTNAIAVAAGGNQSMALRSDGSILTWGNTTGSVPADLTNAIAIAAGEAFCLALRSNRTVAAWGNNSLGQTNVPAGLTNVVAIAAGSWHGLALKADGTVVAWGDNAYNQATPPSGLSNVMAFAAGRTHSVALKNDGSVVAWGDNSSGQSTVPTTLTGGRVKAVAAGGYHTGVSLFSPLVQYLVDVTKDLLLIYNTTSVDSSNVCSYYLEHRPMVAAANVLGIACTNNETVTPQDCSSQIITPITNWLTLNPTKRPQYVILFADIPIRVNDTVYTNPTLYAFGGESPDVGVQIRTTTPGWQPFVNYIHFGSASACMAYVDKIATFGSNYSPGRLLISAGSYSNPNYYVDDVRDGFPQGVGAVVTNALAAAGISSSNIIFSTDQVTPPGNHITNATDVAAYFSIAGHSSLGPNFPTDGSVRFNGNSAWYVMTTYESFNGRLADPGLSCFGRWFASNAFGGSNYSNIPVGAMGNADEEGVPGVPGFFIFWLQGKNLAASVWSAMATGSGSYPYAVAVGDPFTVK